MTLENAPRLGNPAEAPGAFVTETIRFDGAHWQVIDTLDGTTWVTSLGRHLVEVNNLGHLLYDYAQDMSAGRESQQDTRRFIAEGGNARVFAVGDSPLVVKEKLPYSHHDLQPQLDRMDQLAHIIQTHCPHWIYTPKLYGVYLPAEDPERQYMLMEKVDEGITIADVLNIDEKRQRSQHLAEMVLKIFGTVTDDVKNELHTRYGEMHKRLQDASYQEGIAPDSLLVDIRPLNVIVEPLSTPVGGSNYRLSLIDQ